MFFYGTGSVRNGALQGEDVAQITFADKVRKYMEQYGMTSPGDHVYAGLSGGPDSVCLLAVLADLRERMGFQLTAVHVHHGIRSGSADLDAEFCEKTAAE